MQFPPIVGACVRLHLLINCCGMLPQDIAGHKTLVNVLLKKSIRVAPVSLAQNVSSLPPKRIYALQQSLSDV